MTGRRLRQGHTWEAWRHYDRKTVKTRTHLGGLEGVMTGRRLRQGHTWEAWRLYDRKTVKTRTHLGGLDAL